MSCEKQSAEAFHSAQQKEFCTNSVILLTKKESFLTFEAHKQYLEQLQYAWFIAPLVLFLGLYSDIVCGLYLNMPFPFGIIGSTVATTWPSICTLLALVILLYGFGLAAVCAFAGNFTDYVAPSTVWAYVASTVATQAIAVLFLGSEDNYLVIPAQSNNNATTFSPRLFNSSSVSVNSIVFERLPAGFVTSLLCDILLPLQGPVLFGLHVFAQRQRHWKRSHHWPNSLLTIPASCVIFSFFWHHFSQQTVLEVREKWSSSSHDLDYDGILGWFRILFNAMADAFVSIVTAVVSSTRGFVTELLVARSDVLRVWSNLFTEHLCSGRMLHRLWSYAVTQGTVFYFLAIFAPLSAGVLGTVASGVEALMFSSLADASAAVRRFAFGTVAVACLAAVIAADSLGILTAAIALASLASISVLLACCFTEDEA